MMISERATLPAVDGEGEFCVWAAVEAAWRKPLRLAVEGNADWSKLIG